MRRLVVLFAAAAHSSAIEVGGSARSGRNVTTRDSVPAEPGLALTTGDVALTTGDGLAGVFERAGMLLERGMLALLSGADVEDQARVSRDFNNLQLLVKKMQGRYASEISSLKSQIDMQKSLPEPGDSCTQELMKQRAALDTCTQELLGKAPPPMSSPSGHLQTNCHGEVQAATEALEQKCAAQRQQDKVQMTATCASQREKDKLQFTNDVRAASQVGVQQCLTDRREDKLQFDAQLRASEQSCATQRQQDKVQFQAATQAAHQNLQIATQAAEQKCSNQREQDQNKYRELCARGTRALDAGLKKAWSAADALQLKVAAVSAERQVLQETMQKCQQKVDTLNSQIREIQQDDNDRLSNLGSVNDNLMRDVEARKQMITSLGQELDAAKDDKSQLLESVRSLMHENAEMKDQLQLHALESAARILTNRSDLPGLAGRPPKKSTHDLPRSSRISAAIPKPKRVPVYRRKEGPNHGNWNDKMDQIDSYLSKLSPNAWVEAHKGTARPAESAAPFRRGPFSWPDPAAPVPLATPVSKVELPVAAAAVQGETASTTAAPPSLPSVPTAPPMSEAVPTPDARGFVPQNLRGAPALTTTAPVAVGDEHLASTTAAPAKAAVQVVGGAAGVGIREGPDAILEGSAAAQAATRDLSEAEALIPAAVPESVASLTVGASQDAQAAEGTPAPDAQPKAVEAGGSDGSDAASRALGEAEALMASALAL